MRWSEWKQQMIVLAGNREMRRGGEATKEAATVTQGRNHGEVK